MRFRPLFAVPLALALGVPAFAQSSPSPSGMMNDSMMKDSKSGSPMMMKLQPQNGSNETGTVMFTQTPNGLLVNVTTDTAPDAPQAAHIHKGTCANLDPAPAYPLSSVAKGKNSSGKTVGMSSTTFAGMTMSQMMTQPYAVNIHKAGDLKTYVSCADIKPAGAMAPSK